MLHATRSGQLQRRRAYGKITSAFVGELKVICGAERVHYGTSGRGMLEACSKDAGFHDSASPDVVVQPKSTEEVQVRWAPKEHPPGMDQSVTLTCHPEYSFVLLKRPLCVFVLVTVFR